jgi:hypothetical protein
MNRVAALFTNLDANAGLAYGCHYVKRTMGSILWNRFFSTTQELTETLTNRYRALQISIKETTTHNLKNCF